MIDIALAIDHIKPGAAYRGSVTANTREAWDAVVWQEPDTVKPTWAEIEAAWAAIAPDPLTEAISAKLAEVMSGYSAAFAPIEATYPREEREGWPIQLEEARAVLADPDADALTLAILVTGRGMGETVEEFAHLVLSNNMAYRAIYGTLTSQQQRMYRDVESMAATPGITAEEIAAYPVEYVMPDGLGDGV